MNKLGKRHNNPRLLTALEYMYAGVPRAERRPVRKTHFVPRHERLIRADLGAQLDAMHVRWKRWAR